MTCDPETAESADTAVADPMLTITDIALRKIAEAREKMALPVKGLRVMARPVSPLRANFSLRFEPAQAPPCDSDLVIAFDGIDLYLARDCAPYLVGATIDYVFSLLSSEFKVQAPLRKLDTPDGRTAERIQSVLDRLVNPALATHGGGAVLIDFREGIAYVELTGGCQGCSMAGATMRDSIDTSLRNAIPEVREVRDVTRHAKGTRPFYS